ncbi:MAG: magnesium-translocating P-type ATPase [Gaiellaceae bacterium]|jgi:Mg2+-importing ATPase
MDEPQQLELAAAAALPVADALSKLGSSEVGLSSVEAGRRLAVYGPNALLSHGVSALSVLVRQLRSYLLLLLLVAAVVSAVVGDRTEALIIGGIMLMSVGLSFLNEYRSEKAVEALHSQIRHLAFVDRDGKPTEVSVTEIVPGDLVHLRVGDVVPADLRLLEAHELECDESVLTGESQVAAKTADAHPPGESPLDLPSCAFMGTLVRAGDGRGLVVRTGSRTAFGAIALRLGEAQAQTSFQQGLQAFSQLLATVTALLAGSIFVINAALGRSLLQSALFALAIAVGLTPQLLPAIVTVSLATGARRLARRQVIVKRLVCIEDLGNVQVLFTDKTGTLTEGHISFTQPLDWQGKPDDHVRALGLACSDKAGNELDRALYAAPIPAENDSTGWTTLDRLPFDHERQLASVLVDAPQGRLLIAKGAPEAVLARCADVSGEAQATLDRLFASGARVVAVASRAVTLERLGRDDERDLSLDGFLCFTDPAKANVQESLARLARLGITVKVVTGDNGQVAAHLCGEVGLDPGTVVTGAEIAAMDDAALLKLLPQTTIFARVTPEQKSRIILAERSLGADVGFLGDGVNDAIALHNADVGISVDSAADVAKDAADVVLLDKDLGIIADGVVEGRRIFANTIKYVLMGTSSNFGNMFSAAGASLFLSFLPMLPTQILLNNLLYDVSEMTIPTDNVDEELLARPSQWDIRLIRRFMAFFGPISSVYDFLTFAVMLRVFHAGATLFRSGWFVESLTTQTLVIFVIRSRRVPFFKSRPSRPLLAATLSCAALGVALPYIGPLAHLFGFRPLPLSFLAVLAGMIVTYLALAQLGVALFFKPQGGRSLARVLGRHERHVSRRASRWSIWRHGIAEHA